MCVCAHVGVDFSYSKSAVFRADICLAVRAPNNARVDPYSTAVTRATRVQNKHPTRRWLRERCMHDLKVAAARMRAEQRSMDRHRPAVFVQLLWLADVPVLAKFTGKDSTCILLAISLAR